MAQDAYISEGSVHEMISLRRLRARLCLNRPSSNLLFIMLLLVGFFSLRFYHDGSGLVTDSSPMARLAADEEKTPQVEPDDYLPELRQEAEQQPGNVGDMGDESTSSRELNMTALHRIVHLDLKGASPKASHVRNVLTTLSKWGATGVMLEYEDMFPFRDNLSIVARPDAYTEASIIDFVIYARKRKLSLIPLVQTFGHLEFILKHDQFKHLRQVPDEGKSLNVRLDESFTLITTIIDQVIRLHPTLNYLHIGCDEVYYSVHPQQSQQLLDDRNEVYLRHVIKVLKYIKAHYPKVQPIMWDDLFEGLPLETLRESGIGSLVEPMVYDSKPKVDIPNGLWEKYAEVFGRIWTASAFKCATTSTQLVVDSSYRIQNHVSWMAVMKNVQAKFYKDMSIHGIALTGWARYEYQQPLCELLPSGMPSLALCLFTINNTGVFDHKVHNTVSMALKCESDALINLNPAHSKSEHAHCVFPGSIAYNAICDLSSTYGLMKNNANETIIKKEMFKHVRNLPLILLRILNRRGVKDYMINKVVDSLNTPVYKGLATDVSQLLYQLYPWMEAQ